MRIQSLRPLQPNRVKYTSTDWYQLASSGNKLTKTTLAGTGNATISIGSNVVTLATYVPHTTFDLNREIQINGETNYIDSVTGTTFVCRNNFTTAFTGAWAYTVVSNQIDQSSTKDLRTVGAGFDPHLVKESDGNWGLQYVATSTSAYKQLFYTTTVNYFWYTGPRVGFLCTFKLTGVALGGNSPERLIYHVRNAVEWMQVNSSGNLEVKIGGSTYNLGAVTIGVKYTVGWYYVQSGNADGRIVAINTSGQLVTLSPTGTGALTNDFIYVGAGLYDISGNRRRPLNGYIYNIAVTRSKITDMEFYQMYRHLKLKQTL